MLVNLRSFLEIHLFPFGIRKIRKVQCEKVGEKYSKYPSFLRNLSFGPDHTYFAILHLILHPCSDHTNFIVLGLTLKIDLIILLCKENNVYILNVGIYQNIVYLQLSVF